MLGLPTGLSVFGVQVAVTDLVVYGWFALVVRSVVYVAYDAFTRNPEMTVMKWGWVLVTRAVARDARGLRQAAVAVAGLDDPLRGR